MRPRPKHFCKPCQHWCLPREDHSCAACGTSVKWQVDMESCCS